MAARLLFGASSKLEGDLKRLALRCSKTVWSSPEFIHWVHTALNKVLGTRLIADGPFGLEDPYEYALRV